MKKITVKWLTERKACKGQVAHFQELFGEEVEITLDNLTKAVAIGLNLNWLAREMGMAKFQYQAQDQKAVPDFWKRVSLQAKDIQGV